MIRFLVSTAVAFLIGAVPAAAYCKVALSLALDVSSSVNDYEYRLQLDGFANALQSPDVQRAILTPKGAYIEATAYEWSGVSQQNLIVDWTRLDTPWAIGDFANRLRRNVRQFSESPTALDRAVEFGAKLPLRGPPCEHKVLDVSGDGENNDGLGPVFFRDLGLPDGLTVNGLVILVGYPNPATYYREKVIHGPNASLAQAMRFEDYREVMIGKPVREIDAELILGQITE